ncbi:MULTISPECIES: Hsp20/alpha crystallin family protein [Pontibacillus]|uniref:Hsp20/alpha crystallin family protein n=1 Tax=Pontibacillus chungwhensis TaxID=265426 RepID=A0ABY8V1X2_9BACI|nr:MULTISPECIES: Hsp20/alpha crystallin family protein [Pontibacillus]MCD5322329.1 Hsp20/alpha crystallin family protein [Pontibacillus sp. HN14]WIF99620.1 Hsp20/alpha crystallin family protein [Pontibacillus chungwhensis]
MSQSNKPTRGKSMFDDLFQINPNRSFLEAIDDFFTDSFQRGSGVRVDDTKKAFTVWVELPGVRKEDIDIELYDQSLRIVVDQSESIKESTTGYFRQSKSHFERTIALPENIIVRDMKAKHKDGVLEVSFPKRRGRKIEIE